MSNNDSQSLSTNNAIIPLQDYHDENKETVVIVNKSRKTIKKWIILAIVLIVIVAIITPIILVSKVSSNRILSGKCYTFKYLMYLSTFF
jgi:uncharacterized membrane protein YukC